MARKVQSPHGAPAHKTSQMGPPKTKGKGEGARVIFLWTHTVKAGLETLLLINGHKLPPARKEEEEEEGRRAASPPQKKFFPRSALGSLMKSQAVWAVGRTGREGTEASQGQKQPHDLAKSRKKTLLQSFSLPHSQTQSSAPKPGSSPQRERKNCLFIVAMFLIGSIFGYTGTYVVDSHNQLLYPGGNVLPHISSPEGFPSAFPVGLLPSVQPPPRSIGHHIHDSVQR
ncbi:hypothetical protein BTVI_70621 [Pitangus sulphuratus]|nr:hypothetical protein BTVI_70621 [Pitangus sulphuratus]